MSQEVAPTIELLERVHYRTAAAATDDSDKDNDSVVISSPHELVELCMADAFISFCFTASRVILLLCHVRDQIYHNLRERRPHTVPMNNIP
jgi:hypothetical protein